MAAIHLIKPPHGISAAGHHLQILASAHAEGVELGPHGLHIRALSQSTGALLPALQQEHDALTRSSTADNPEVRQVLNAVSALNAASQRLIRAGRTYPFSKACHGFRPQTMRETWRSRVSPESTMKAHS